MEQRTARNRGGYRMSLKMQADIDLLRAHYDELSTRLAELEDQVKLMNNVIGVLAVDAGDKKNLQGGREDLMNIITKITPTDNPFGKSNKRKRTHRGKR
jgi:hypothetical protein